MSKILIIEDEKAIRSVLSNILKDEYKDYEILEAEDGLKGWEIMQKETPNLVICDIKMPKMDGIEVLEKAMKMDKSIPFLIISGHGDLETAVEAMRKGAYDYISKPPDLNRLLNAIRNGLERKKLLKQNTELKEENKSLRKKISKNHQIIGSSKALMEIQTLVEKAAPTNARVLITGPNGSGKELIAKQLHEKSLRNDKPMIEVNCAAIPAELIESELFGHVKGSFTGAIKDKNGKFKLVDSGTLFLDEVADMSLSAQAKVLRVLQENVLVPVGGDKEVKIDVRIIAATNKNLEEEIKEGRFREDLYHRLAVIPLHVPSLAERKDDIPALVTHFSKLLSEELGTAEKKFTKEAIDKLMEKEWTGNIRELRNIVERLMILGGKEVTAADVEAFVK